MRLWLTCFSIAAAVTAFAGPVTGRVEIMGGKASPKDRRSNAGVAVWLEPLDGTVVPAIRPGKATMVQQKKEFRPHVLAIPVGTVVDFPNFDPIFHNAFSNASGQQFDVGLYPPGTSRQVAFRRPGIVRVFCNIHQSMSAVIVVQPTPYLAVSDEKGTFAFSSVAPGRYAVHAFYERATQSALDALSRDITVGAGPTEVPTLTVSESGYLAVPHKNKYGRDYPPDTGDNPVYSGEKHP
jgi:plastocyanin